MSIRKREIPIIILVLWLMVWNFGITEIANYYSVNIVAWIVRILAIIYMFNEFSDKTKVKRINFLAGIIIVAFLLYYCIRTQNTRYFDTIFFLYALRKINYKYIINVVFKTQFFIVVFTVFLSFINIIPNEAVFNAGRQRYNLGYIYCSYAANMFFFTVAHYFAGRKRTDKFNWWLVAVFLGINQIIFYYSDTKASYWGTLLLILFEIIASRFPISTKRHRIGELMSACIFPGFALLSVIAGLVYNPNNAVFSLLNTISSGRIYMVYLGLQRYGIKLLGSDLTWSTDHTSEYLYVDSSYVNILLTLGLIFLVLICLGFARVAVKSVRNKDLYLTIALLFVAIHCFTDPQLLDLRYNGFILLCVNAMVYGEAFNEAFNEALQNDMDSGGNAYEFKHNIEDYRRTT
ncbi:hypothetical protein [Clostridium transplantifaecale]|uniref:hypothetical protein n=1 Tax=Clostridium transplantifaecale TaxID=2479838 RepID=UPI0013DE3B38|nr:hypothetical protein [Clostridium transplantifaecale]